MKRPNPKFTPHHRAKPRPANQPIKPAATKTDWNEVANWYDQHVGDTGSEFHREVVLPGTTRLLALNPGQHALDVACGQGVLARLLASKNITVTAIDAAADLIKAARERSTESSTTITYKVADARELDFLPENTFHAAACVLAIQNIHPIAPVFTGVARALQTGGRFVLVMMHPCFRGPKETAWGWDEKVSVQFRRVNKYLLPRKSPIITNPGKDPDTYTWSFHKPIEAYVKALRNAGLLIDAMEEWTSHKKSDSGPRAPAENIAREEIPMFMAIRAIKVAKLSSEASI